MKHEEGLYSVHIELASHIALIHCAIHRYTPCTIGFSQGFWFSILPSPFMFVDAKLLAVSKSAVEWYKSHAHNSFLSEVIQYYVPTHHEQSIAKEKTAVHLITADKIEYASVRTLPSLLN